MKIAVCGDIHFSRTSSIIKSAGSKYSKRLENCIASVNWFEQISKENNCELEVFLGDVFDTDFLDDETITATRDIIWNDIKKQAIVGNHESSSVDLKYSALKIFESQNFEVIRQPKFDAENKILYLPYQIEQTRGKVSDYLPDNTKANIIFSHNDIKNVRYGQFLTTEGYELEDLNTNANLVLNGHIHNHGVIGDKIINLGNLTGQNYCENAFKYSHKIAIIDTDTLKVEFFENPVAFNFYKIDVETAADIKRFINRRVLKSNAVVSVRCTEQVGATKSLAQQVTAELKELSDIVTESRVSSIINTADCSEVERVEDFSIDYLADFSTFIKTNLGDNKLVQEELQKICN